YCNRREYREYDATAGRRQLPTRTWNHLNVNEATIPWNVAETADLGTDAYEITAENQAQPLHIRLTGAEGCSRKHIAVDVAAGVQATVYMVLDAQGQLRRGNGADAP
ncbi:MAG: hypothetical protein ACLUNO_06710, partial [Oscillospiraceae bacterium]